MTARDCRGPNPGSVKQVFCAPHPQISRDLLILGLGYRSAKTAPNMAARNCLVAPSISCCRTGSIAARLPAKARLTLGIIRQKVLGDCLQFAAGRRKINFNTLMVA